MPLSCSLRRVMMMMMVVVVAVAMVMLMLSSHACSKGGVLPKAPKDHIQRRGECTTRATTITVELK